MKQWAMRNQAKRRRPVSVVIPLVALIVSGILYGWTILYISTGFNNELDAQNEFWGVPATQRNNSVLELKHSMSDQENSKMKVETGVSEILNGVPNSNNASHDLGKIQQRKFAPEMGEFRNDGTSILDLINFTKTETAYWDKIEEFATGITTSSFCLPWSVNSDSWWLHHPDFEIFKETDDQYCFRLLEKDEKVNFMRNVYRNQFHGNCSNTLTAMMWSSGFGADMNNLVDNLQFALNGGRPMQVHKRPWHYAAPDEAGKPNKTPSKAACPLLTMYCYFLNLSSCEQKSSEEFSRDYYNARKPGHFWLKDYILRPQTWLRHQVYKFVQNQTIKTPCTVLHVRRSDVVRHSEQSRKYHHISEYLNTSSKIRIFKNILLLTDDQNAISEAGSLFPEYNWIFIDRPRWKGAAGGWERQLPSSDPSFEMLVLLSTFQLVKKCKSFVHSSSSLSKWIKDSMNRRAQVFDLDKDVPWESIHNLRNRKTKFLSKTYDSRPN